MDKYETLYHLEKVIYALEEFYPLMDMTDFQNAKYSLQDDIEEDDGR